MVKFANPSLNPPMNREIHVCHITTIHPSKDVRIFHKECASIANAGYKVTLLVGNGIDELSRGVQIKKVEIQYSGRIERFVKAGKAMYEAALKEKADLYQFHDPEFLPFAVKLQRKTGAKVIYDVHEDVPRQLLDKHYLPKWLSRLMSAVLEKYEDGVVRKLDAIITADDKVTDRFETVNKSVVCLKNYADLIGLSKPVPFSRKKKQICHIGSLTKVRGIVELVEAMENVNAELHIAGAFSPIGLQEEVSALPGWNKVVYHGFVGRDEVRQILADSIVGTVTLHPIDKYLDALPVKMFEYMAAGIPVVTSTIPMWKQIVDDADCGVAVDPKNPAEISDAINNLLRDLNNAELLGLNGRTAVEEKFNWLTQEELLLQLYTELLHD